MKYDYDSTNTMPKAKNTSILTSFANVTLASQMSRYASQVVTLASQIVVL